MPEYISRERAIFEAKYEFGNAGARVIARVPVVDIPSLRQGKWIHTEGNLYCCSVCGGYPSYIPTHCRTSKFCPNCGAKMDGDD